MTACHARRLFTMRTVIVFLLWLAPYPLLIQKEIKSNNIDWDVKS